MWGIRMDDLDHSIHIAEYDWASFYEESEECGLLQPSLARPDDSSLSDSEDSGNLSSVPQETQQSPDVKSAAAAGGSAATKLPAQLNLSGATGQEDDTATKAEEGFEIHLDFPGGNTVNTEVAHIKTAENITEETSESEELTKDGDVQPESDLKPSEEPDPLSSQQTRLNVNEPHTAERAVMEDLSKAFRAEKERWFVTVNDSPAQQRLSAASVKKKQRQKKVSEGNHMCSSGQENSLKDKNEFEMNEDRDESWGGGDTQPNQNLNKNSGGKSSDETKAEVRVTSDLPQMSNDEEDLSEKLVISPSANENITETMMHRDKFEPGGTASTSRGTFKQVESVESDELEDSVEFLSIHSYDSESYLSAAESVDEAQHPLPEHLIENQQLLFSLFERHLFSLTEDTDADWTQDGQMHSCDLSSDVSAADCEGYESTGAESSLTFPSAGRRATTVPDDNSTCDNNTHSTMLCVPPDTPEPQTREMNLSAPGCSQVDRPGPLLVPDLTITPCPAADSPETYAQAAGHTRPVYAISAFWDEMEKLTINDILQLRTGRSTPLRHNTQDTVTSNADDSPTNPGSLVDTAEYGSSDSTLMDTSDTADSDYFTQTDESKPDRSSCEFSTSDFEEEYWQFLGTSRNPSPDPQSKHQHRRRDSSFLSHEEESTGSEGKETPVPLEDFAGRCSDDHEPQTLTSGELALPRPITKSRSMQNIHDLNTEGLSLLGTNEGGLSLSRCSPLEDNVVVTMSDSLGSLLPASLSNSDFLDAHYQISFPEVFEYFFTEDIENIKSQCVTVYDPQDISVAPVFDYALCTFSDETSSSSVQCSEEEKPIPIFSCCPPTVRDLTFPKPDYVFLSSNCEEVEDISPIRVVSHSFIQADHHSGSHSWKSLLSIRKIRFHDKGSIWCRRSGAWMFPVEFEKRPIKTEDPVVAVLSEGRVCPAASQLFRELEEQQRILETIRTTRREGVFSTLKQSDMCLVCIAFASWVLRSSDPEAADAWKAALLANVSALSAIQYLRQYVKKKNPPPDEP